MKKFIPVMVVAMCALMFTSCKKDYTCTCKITVTGGGTTPDVVLKLNNVTKGDAKDGCKAAETTYSVAGTASCSL